jgi:hypothetical protein
MMRQRALSMVLVLGLMAGSAEASAILIVNGSGILLGATGVTVDGALYDVEFLDGTCVALFSGCDDASDFQFQTDGAATLAAQALLDQVFLDGPLGTFDSSPELVNGCSIDLQVGYVCFALVPWEVRPFLSEPAVFAGTAENFGRSFHDGTDRDRVGAGTLGFTITDDLGNFPVVYARYRATLPPPQPVPEPATVALVGMGLVGMGLARRRRRG